MVALIPVKAIHVAHRLIARIQGAATIHVLARGGMKTATAPGEMGVRPICQMIHQIAAHVESRAR